MMAFVRTEKGKTMDDYIKREDAIEKLEFHISMDLLDDIKDIPPADVAPVRHGHWIVLQQTSIPTIWNCKCSECGAYETKTSNYQANYCPNCGAKMDYNEWLASKDR